MGYLTTIILCLIELTSSFNIVSHSQSSEVLQVGDSLTLLCKTDKRWEYCDWKHKDPVSGETRHCSLEWKRASGNVEMQKCNMELKDRIRISGDYQNHECGLKVTSLALEDGGTWECEMEEYQWGDLISGTRHVKGFNLNVNERPLVTTPGTTSSTTTTTTSTTVSTTEVFTTTDTQFDDLDTSDAPEDVTTDVSDTTEYLNMQDNDTFSVEKGVDAGNQTDEINIIGSTERNDTSEVLLNFREAAGLHDANDDDQVAGGVVAGIVVAVIALVIGVAVGALMVLKKRKSLDVLTLQKIKETGKGGGTNSFLEEAEYSMSEGFVNLTPPS